MNGLSNRKTLTNTKTTIITTAVFEGNGIAICGCHGVTALQPWDEIVPLGCRAVVLRQPQFIVGIIYLFRRNVSFSVLFNIFAEKLNVT